MPQLTFAPDAHEAPLELYHKLKLYDDQDPTNQSTKKPVQHLFLQLFKLCRPASLGRMPPKLKVTSGTLYCRWSMSSMRKLSSVNLLRASTSASQPTSEDQWCHPSPWLHMGQNTILKRISGSSQGPDSRLQPLLPTYSGSLMQYLADT